MRPPVDPEIYATLERATPYLVGWLTLFTVVIGAKIVRGPRGPLDGAFVPPAREGMVASELPGLPLMLLHSVGFGLSLWRRDPVSALLFLWWGPGYLFVATTLLVRARRKSPPIDWKPYARATSWLCKLSYVAFVAIYLLLDLPGIPFVFSAWIVQDQVKLTWLRGNADRTRRVAEDLWVPRVLYAALLGLPFFFEVALRPLAAGLGVVLLVAWLAGLARVARAGRFRARPDPRSSDNLRDIVYLLERPI